MPHSDLYLVILFTLAIAWVIFISLYKREDGLLSSRDDFIDKELKKLVLQEKKDNFYSANRFITKKIEYYRLLAQLLQEKEEFDTTIKRHGFKDDSEFIDSLTTKIKYPSSPQQRSMNE